MIFRILFEICLAMVVSGGKINDTCTTTSLQVGRCVLVANCPYALRIIRADYNTPEELYYINYNECGTVPDGKYPKKLICCPSISNVPNCGVKSRDLNNRITGGEESTYGEFPWAGLIRYKVGKKRFITKCGCTLLNTRWVLTAAHCITSVPSSWKLHQVVFSEWNAKKKATCNPDVPEHCRKEYLIEEHIVHEMFERSLLSMYNDIAMLKTDKEVEFNDYVRPVCLPFSLNLRELNINTSSFIVSGWGQTEQGADSAVQRYVEISGKNNEVCDKAFAPLGITLSEDQICVGGERGKDSCRGDSGGPLIYEEGLVSYIIGIVSLGAQKCGTENHPGVYTKVVNYLDWIEDVMLS